MHRSDSLALDPRDYKIGRVLFRRMARLTLPYWRRAGAWGSWTAVTLLFLLVIVGTYGTYLSSFLVKDLTNALIAGRAAEFWRNLALYLMAFAIIESASPLMQVVESRLNQHWREWLTIRLVDRYLAKRTYYDIALAEDLDNPDQRLQQCVTPFVNSLVSFPRLVVYQFGMMVTGVAILLSIDRRMVAVTLACGLVQVVVMFFVYVPTVRKNFEMMVAEADLRYGILHVRDHAEAIAFYHGEAAERTHILDRLSLAVRRNLDLLYYYAVKITGTYAGFRLIWASLPYFLLAPIVLSGGLSYGSFAQGLAAANQLLSSMFILSQFLPLISAAAPQAVRLAQIQERFDLLEKGRARSDHPRLVKTSCGRGVRLRHVTLETPGGEQQLVRDLTLSVEPGEHLAIVGQTGVGKSSLLRAMAGLWSRGHGELDMPPPGDCLFLPQRPYMILADLRSQLLYPHGGAGTTDDELRDILHRAVLPDLLDTHGGLDAVRDWGKVLSLGEQQRIGFARVLVSRPGFVFLDEATSAVDFATEERLYQLMRATGASFISIGHRLSILDHHTHLLTLKAGGEWSLDPIDKKTLALG